MKFMEQRTKEWYDSRIGCFTASKVHEILKPSGFGITGHKYIRAIAAQEFTGEPTPEINSKILQWGRDCEPYAIEHYESAFGKKISPIGFVKNEKFSNECGASPDGVILHEDVGVEFKCPYTSAEHIHYMQIKNANDLKSVNIANYWQVQNGLFITGYKKWEFISYDPRFPEELMMYVVPIYPVKEDIEFMKLRLLEAIKIKHQLVNRVKSLIC